MTLKMRVHGELVTLTEETITKTNQWYSDNAQGCIDEALSGAVFVNDIESYVKGKKELKDKYLSGEFEIGLWYYQQAYYIQTSESVGILG